MCTQRHQQIGVLLLPSSPPCVSLVWDCLVYRPPLTTIDPPLPPPPPPPAGLFLCCVGERYALSPLLPGYGIPPPLCALVPPLLVGWPLVFGLLCWLLGWLVGCWTVESSWLIGWLVGWLVAWLLAWLVGCWLVAGLYVFVLPGHMLCGVVANFVHV